MSQLSIVDLDFCEGESPIKSEIKGGAHTNYSPTGASSTSSSSDSNSSHYVSYFFDRRTGAFGYSIGFGYSGAVAGAAAGAASDGGYRYVSSYTGAYAY
jgi:hypothetical protein